MKMFWWRLILLVCCCLFLRPLLPAQPGAVHVAGFIPIGGVDQWVTISGNDSANPVVLFLHGGPGSVMSPYDKSIYQGWDEEFVLVHWDQRGAGRTFGRNAPAEVNEDFWIQNPLTVEQMTDDGIALSQHLIKTLGKQKIIIVGTSWGSVLGVQMALKRPDLFYAYIGHAQVIDPTAQLASSFDKVRGMAQDAGDSASLDKLRSIGAPPYEDARSYGLLFRVIKQYERANSVAPPAAWWKLAPEYDNETDSQHRYDGDDYSFINYVGHRKLGIKPMMSDINFMMDGLDFRIPVYLIQGQKDILTPPGIAKRYFDKLKAPEKRFFSLEEAAHGYNQSVIDTQYRILKEYVSPVIKE